MNTEIDTGEVIVAVIGLRPIISKKVEKVTKSDLDKIADFPMKIKRLAKQLVAGSLKEKDEMPPEKYDTFLERLTSPFDEAQIEKTIGSFPGDAEDKLSAMTIAHRAFDLVASVLPKSVYQSMFSSANLAVSDPQWWTFQESFELLNDPLLVFNDIATGELLNSQATAMREIYPTISRAIDDAIKAANAEEIAKTKSFELPVNVEFGCATWFKMPIDVAPYQQSYTIGDAQRNASPQPSSSQSSAAAASSLSFAERAALEPVTGKR